MTGDTPTAPTRSAQPERGRVVAAIELGTTSIRMAVAQVNDKGELHILETLQQAVSLGRDAFTKEVIEKDTTEECVHVLRSFRKVLAEYQLTDSSQITAVATSAVREASNTEAFLDRVYIATGINVNVIDASEVNRLTYMGITPILKANRQLLNTCTLAVEVGGGSTEVLTLKRGLVVNAQAFRMGSLRLRRLLEEYQASASGLMEILRNQVDRTVAQVASAITARSNMEILALGGDARFAATRLQSGWEEHGLARLKLPNVKRLADSVLRMTPDEIVQKHHISYPDAETLGPALLVYAKLAQAFRCKTILVGRATLRDGLLLEMTTHGSWTEEFRKQVINSALELTRKYKVDTDHAARVAALSEQLFRALRNEHMLDPRYEMILTIAGHVHEIGAFVSNRSHHKHSMYLIMNSDVFGVSSNDLFLTALVSRYHRGAMPKSSHEYYDQLDRESRVIVTKLAAILRIADALSRRDQEYSNADLLIQLEAHKKIVIGVDKQDLTLELHALRQKADMFEHAYGMNVELRSTSGEHSVAKS